MLKKGEANFLVKFLAIFFALFFLLKIADLDWLLKALAGIEAWLLAQLGVLALLDGNEIILEKTRVLIVPECSGLFMPILLASLLWSTRLENARRLKFMLIFTPLLFLFNLARLLVTILPLAFFPALFTPIHVFLWFVDSALVLWVWMLAQGIKLREILGKPHKGMGHAQ
ncbi:MAG: archaeosortase/exosortase family protein [Candidatus Micrarchaeota archaeon]